MTLLSGVLGGNQVFAEPKVRDFETTRMSGSAGAGVGALLLDEATFLNPASLAFFKLSSAYIQRTGVSISNQSNQETVLDPPASKNMGFVLSDTSRKVKGSLSYVNQTEGFNERRRFGVSMAHPVTQKSSIGATYRMSKDRLSENGFEYDDQDYKQWVFGATHSVSKELTMGLVVNDPTQKKKGDTRGILGAQYEYESLITLLFDVGSDYNKTLSDSLLYRGAFQIKAFKDFYFRVGAFNDKGRQEKGSGIGLSWVQPKLMFGFSFKNTEVIESEALSQSAQKIKESSFSISYRM